MTEYERLCRKEMKVYCIKWCIFIVTLVAIVGGLIYIGERVERKRCYSRYADFQPEYVGSMTGCMITVDEQRAPASALRITY